MGELSYIFRLNHAFGDSVDLDAFIPKPNWYRTFEVSDSYTLENLSSIILDILDWDCCHLYKFNIKDTYYAALGFDVPIIIDWPGKYISCDTPIYALSFDVNSEFTYLYDFGDLNRFILSVTEIREIKKRTQPILLAYEGKNLVQYNYPYKISKDTEKKEITDIENKIPSINSTHVLNREDTYHVRFIHNRDKEILERWRKSNEKNKWQKAVTILDNWTLDIEQISLKVERNSKIIKKWIKLFNSQGIESLAKDRKKRETSKLQKNVEEKRKRILEIYHQKPSLFRINRSNWTNTSLALAYKNKYNEVISRSTVSRLIRKTGYSQKKARRVLTSQDPDYREKVELLLNTLQSLQPNEIFFFIDELGPLRVKKYGGRAYMKNGTVQTIPQSQKDKGSITMAAALSATTNQVTWSYSKSKDTSSMIDLVEILFNQHHNKLKIYITWDAASWHSSNEFLDWLDEFNAHTEKKREGPIIYLVPLPSNSQFLNVIESVFSGMKRAVIHHSDYQSEEQMKNAISCHFKERNEFFKLNPKRVGKKIWEIDFFTNPENIKSGDYREW